MPNPSRRMSLRRETIRQLIQPELSAVQGGSVVDATTVLIRETIKITISVNTQCASSCLTDPPTCLCPSFPCPTGEQ